MCLSAEIWQQRGSHHLPPSRCGQSRKCSHADPRHAPELKFETSLLPAFVRFPLQAGDSIRRLAAGNWNFGRLWLESRSATLTPIERVIATGIRRRRCERDAGPEELARHAT